jgi:fumarate reductase flavoprotein subunit
MFINSNSASEYASKVKETLDADIAVVGSGVSGLATGVQAAELGLKTILIEVSSSRGGSGPEGIAAIGSSLQKKLGIEISLGDVIEHDAIFFNYRLNNLFWQDMLKASADNIDWLINKGVEFSGVVDDYKGMGKFNMFHWFPGDHNCGRAYSAHMEKALLSHSNASLVLKTRGRELIMDGDQVVGLYATRSDKSVVRVNSRAVVLATGGYASNYDMVAERWKGLYSGRWECDGVPTLVTV